MSQNDIVALVVILILVRVIVKFARQILLFGLTVVLAAALFGFYRVADALHR